MINILIVLTCPLSILLEYVLKEFCFPLKFLHPNSFSLIDVEQLLPHVFDVALTLLKCLIEL